MRHASRIAKDGTDQFFGIPRISGAAVKQGWPTVGRQPADAIVNTTGFVDHDRYAVAISPKATHNEDQTIRIQRGPGGRRHDDGAPGRGIGAISRWSGAGRPRVRAGSGGQSA